MGLHVLVVTFYTPLLLFIREAGKHISGSLALFSKPGWVLGQSSFCMLLGGKGGLSTTFLGYVTQGVCFWKRFSHELVYGSNCFRRGRDVFRGNGVWQRYWRYMMLNIESLQCTRHRWCSCFDWFTAARETVRCDIVPRWGVAS